MHEGIETMVNAPPQKSKAPTPQAASASAVELYSSQIAAQVRHVAGMLWRMSQDFAGRTGTSNPN
jgi:hypothetical protein